MIEEGSAGRGTVVKLRGPIGVRERWAIFQQRFEAGNLRAAAEMMEAIASDGYVEAYVELGNLYEIESDYEKAANWYQKAADGFPEPFAHARLGALYFNGLGVQRDPAKAFLHLSQGESLRWPHTLLMLGLLFHLGEGTQVDIERARSLYRAAADQGLVLAMHYLCSLEADTKNYLLAVKWKLCAFAATFKEVMRGDPEQKLVGLKQQ
jgi:TPR repeat protein